MNRKGAKDAKFLPEPGAGRKRTAGRGSGKDARFETCLGAVLWRNTAAMICPAERCPFADRFTRSAKKQKSLCVLRAFAVQLLLFFSCFSALNPQLATRHSTA